MVKSRTWIMKVLKEKHVLILAASGVASLVLTFQGIQATFIIAWTNPLGPYRIGQGLLYCSRESRKGSSGLKS